LFWSNDQSNFQPNRETLDSGSENGKQQRIEHKNKHESAKEIPSDGAIALRSFPLRR